MNHTKMAAVLVPAAMLFALAAPAFAQDVNVSTSATASLGTTSASVNASAKLSAVDAKLRDTSTAEISKRVDDLNTLAARVEAMVHVSASTKTSLNASMQTNITALTNLENKIAADTDTVTLKADVSSITKAYRIYLLVVPQTRILAASDRAATIGDMMTALNVKFQTRIAAASAAGRDTTAILKAQADMNAKIADANLQSSTAISGVSGLMPDNGDATVLASNNAALVKARADVRVATSDLTAANKDVKTIIADIKGFNLDTSTTATTQQ